MMDVFDALAGGQPEGPGGAVLNKVGDAVARAMGLDPDDFDAAELGEIWEILAPGRGDVGDADAAAPHDDHAAAEAD